MYNIEKVEADGEILLNFISDSDFEYNLRLYDKCKIINNHNHTIKGFITHIGDNRLVLSTIIGQVEISYDAIKAIEKIELINMRISEFCYVLTDIGGGWGTVHDLYGVTPSGDVYKAGTFDEKTMNIATELDCEYIGYLDKVELGVQPKKKGCSMDASYLVVVDVDDVLKIVYEGDNISENNPRLYNDIEALVISTYNENF